jgi:tetratricopeptide (TPR) repeat protein
MKKTMFLLLFIGFSAAAFARPVVTPWWLSLEQGKQRYRNGEYGRALMLFEDARRDRRAVFEQMERDFINFLSINEVRRIGDSLEFIEWYARERHHTAAYAALQEVFYRIPRSSLNNSATAALEAIDRLKNYPEAEYWIGEIYRVEGELSLALMQFRRALEMRDLFENPGFAIDLKYKIAGVLLIRQEYNEMIRTYNAIINELDTLWTNALQATAARIQPVNADSRNIAPTPYTQASASFAIQAMARILENDGINRFLEFYRYNNTSVEPAHRLLGLFYAVTGRPVAQQHLMFAFLIQNTILIEEIQRRQFDFVFTDLQALSEEIYKIPMLVSYIEEVEYYKTAYYLGATLHRNGRLSVARTIWEFLASQPQAGEWHNRSIMQLRAPYLEPVVEMP